MIVLHVKVFSRDIKGFASVSFQNLELIFLSRLPLAVQKLRYVIILKMIYKMIKLTRSIPAGLRLLGQNFFTPYTCISFTVSVNGNYPEPKHTVTYCSIHYGTEFVYRARGSLNQRNDDQTSLGNHCLDSIRQVISSQQGFNAERALLG